MLEDELFIIRLNNERLSLIKEEQIPVRGDWEERIKVRKSCEEKAKEILLKEIDQITVFDLFVKGENDFEKFGAFNLLDVDAILNNKKIIKARFGQLIPSNTKYLFNRQHQTIQINELNFQKFKDGFDGIMGSNDVELREKYYSKLLTIPGGSAFLATLILYLKDGKQFNIMTERFVKKILKNANYFSNNFDFYLKYNTFINELKFSFNLQPQEIDLILSTYDNPKWDKYAAGNVKNQDSPKDKVKKTTETKVYRLIKSGTIEPFPNFDDLLQEISVLKADRSHKERAHESLVETFFINLGYEKHREIQYRKGRIDICIMNKEKPMIVVEVKKDWNLKNKNKIKELQQVYHYALETGTRYLILTNGDYYLFIDRLKGLSYQDNVVGEFQLTNFKEEDLKILMKLKKEVIFHLNIEELFKNLSLCFK